MVQREVLVGNDHSQHPIATRVAIKLPVDKRRAVMEHCYQQRYPLSDISEAITTLADDLIGEDTTSVSDD